MTELLAFLNFVLGYVTSYIVRETPTHPQLIPGSVVLAVCVITFGLLVFALRRALNSRPSLNDQKADIPLTVMVLGLVGAPILAVVVLVTCMMLGVSSALTGTAMSVPILSFLILGLITILRVL